ELAAAGLVVISGLARGVDGEAHRGALEAAGVTVAVLGCGVDRDYPAVHAQLAARICERGLVVSEYAPGVEPAPWRFPARNRLSRVTPRELHTSNAAPVVAVAKSLAGVVLVWFPSRCQSGWRFEAPAPLQREGVNCRAPIHGTRP